MSMMAWNKSGNALKQDPWGKPGQNGSQEPYGNGRSDQDQRNSENSPPDLEEVFSNLLKKMGVGGNGGNNNKSKKPTMALSKLISLVVGIVVVIWAVSGFYTIQEAERGVVTRLGQLHSIVQPGLNWNPTFIDRVIPVNVERVSELRTQGSMLTQDENMVKVEMTVQYRIHDPAKYLFNVTDADNSLNQATDSALRYVIGHMTMDDVLTTGRAVVRSDTWETLNNIIKVYDMGLEVLDVNFQYARPPEAVKDAFDDAIKAQEDEQRYIREAEAYAREREPIARGNAQRILEEAVAYKDRVVLDAQGEVDRFTQVLPEFRKAPEITKERLYIEAMEQVMANTPKVMLDSNDGNNLTVLPLEQLLGKQKQLSEVLPQSPENRVNSTVVNPIRTNIKAVNTTATKAVGDSVKVRRGRFE